MHSRLKSIIEQHLSYRLRIPDGLKVRRADPKSVDKYKGGSKFSDLEDWLMSFAIMLEAMQYGGDNRDHERVLAIPEFLDSEASRWYCRHVTSVNRKQQHWTFEEVIIGLYDRFVHPSTMQDARQGSVAAT